MAAYYHKHKSYCDKQQWLRYTLFHSRNTREKGGKGEEGQDVREPKSGNIVQFSITFR